MSQNSQVSHFSEFKRIEMDRYQTYQNVAGYYGYVLYQTTCTALLILCCNFVWYELNDYDYGYDILSGP